MSSRYGFQLLCSPKPQRLDSLLKSEVAFFSFQQPLCSHQMYPVRPVCQLLSDMWLLTRAHHGLPQETLLGTHAPPVMSEGAPTATAAGHPTSEPRTAYLFQVEQPFPTGSGPWERPDLALCAPESPIWPPTCCRTGYSMEKINMTSLIWFRLGPSHALKQIFHLTPDSLFRGSWGNIVPVFRLL